MTDLHTRFRTLDSVSAPDLWYDIEERAMAIQPTRRRNPWLLVAVMLLLVLAIGGAVLVGSGVIKLPAVVDVSASPSASAQESSDASTSPVEVVPASWTATGEMVEARTFHTATQLLDGRVLVAGGIGTQTSEFFANILASAEFYDPATGSWTATGPMLGVRTGHTATLLPDGGVLVAGGGSSSDGDGGPLASAELYDPNTGTWTETATMLEARNGGHTATLLGNGKVLVTGGNGSSFDALASAELYDPSTGSWTAAGDMLEARSGHRAMLLLDGSVLVVGGGLASAELYDPTTGQWTATGATRGVLVGNTATLLPDGRVLIAGGMAGTGASSSAEVYDPSTGQWTATEEMIEGRINHSATLLPGGTLLVAGGTDSMIDGGVILTSAELYDPATGSWTTTEGMPVARGGYTATLLGDGTVLVAGGNGISGYLASTELYDPGTGS
jgi:N-acetylneuraminic acid mutarotase